MKLLRFFILLILFNISIVADIKSGTVIVDARAEKLISNILTRLCASSKILSVPKIYFVVDKSVNAFATDQAKIFIHTGLIIKFKNVKQLIAVLAHELGHITGGHMHRMRGEMQGVTAASVLGTLLGGVAALASGSFEPLIAGSMLGQGAAMGTFASFSRTHEKEADAAGFRMLQQANLSTEGFIETFELFKNMNKFGEIPYLQTHPSDQDRINAFIHYRNAHPDAGSIPEEWEHEFQIVQAVFMASLLKPSETERFYYQKNTKAARIARAIVYARKGQYSDAFKKIQELLQESPNNPYLHEMYGQFLLESGNAHKALDHLRRAVQLASNALSIRLLYAQALYTDSGHNAQEAIDQLNRITQDDPDNVMAWLLKVGAYRKLGQQGFADIAQAEAAMRMGDIRLAVSRAQRAKKSDNPKIREQAKMLLEDPRIRGISEGD